MVIGALLLAATQPDVPVVSIDGPLPVTAVAAMTWTCTVRRADGSSINLSGDFPALSVEAQRAGQQYRIESTLRAEPARPFSGRHRAVMTFHMGGGTNYSVAVGEAGQSPEFILQFQFFDQSRQGFLNISQFRPAASSASGGVSTAYAAGLCGSQSSESAR